MPCSFSSAWISVIGKYETLQYLFFLYLFCYVVFGCFLYDWNNYVPLQYVHKRHTVALVPAVVFYLITPHYCQQICNCSLCLFVHRCAKTITRYLLVKIRLSLQLSTFSFALRLSVVYLYCSCWCWSVWSWPLSLWLNVIFVYLCANTHHRVFPCVSTRFSCWLLIVFHHINYHY